MLDWWRGYRTRGRITSASALVADTRGYNSLTAAARAVNAGRERVTPRHETWQDEVWAFYDTLGEFHFAVQWVADMMSRVRLRAGELTPGRDEPKLTDAGLAGELVADLNNTLGGTAQLMSSLTTQLRVPGESWLVGEGVDAANRWSVRSSDEIRTRGRGEFDVVDETSHGGNVLWRPLSDNSMVVRVWRPHKRWHYQADSSARAARATMREIELVNRHIQAQYLSRLASAGVFIIPEEITFPVRAEFQDAPDPFVSEWIETAREAIKTEGTAAAVIPIPMRVPSEYAQAFQHIDFTLKIDEQIVEKRESAIKRLAMQLDIPVEVITGLGATSHWNAWQIEESAIKTHITPDAELISNSLTVGYLQPRMLAEGASYRDVERWVVWYDTSELVHRPDQSENAIKAYDRLEITDEALRREIGFDEDDKPSDEVLRKLILKRMAQNPSTAPSAMEGLFPEHIVLSNPRSPNDESREAAPAESPNTPGPPDTRDDPPPTPDAGLDAIARGVYDAYDRTSLLAARQAAAVHILEFSVTDWQLHHPPICQTRLFSCPVTHVTAHGIVIHPGRSGNYRCWLSDEGTLVIGDVTRQRTEGFIEGTWRVNGSRTNGDLAKRGDT